jgi:Dolichyl-phosphate-mannose-protein mannosyltransferase
VKKKLSKENIIFLILVIIVSRLLVWGIAYLFTVNFNADKPLLDAMCTWDCSWYMSIIKNGYQTAPTDFPDYQANWAFFPLFPLLATFISTVTGIDGLVSGYLVSNISFGIAIFLLFHYCSALFDESTSRFIVTAMAFSPFSLYYSVPYTEALYTLLMITSIHFARSNQWIFAGICAATLSSTRNLGVMIFFPFLILAISRYGWRSLVTIRPGTEAAMLGLLLVPFGLFVYMLFLHLHVGDALAFKNIQIAWDRTPGNPITVIFNALSQGNTYKTYCGFLALIGLLTGFYLFKNKFYPESLIIFIGMLIPAHLLILFLAMPLPCFHFL